MSLVGKKAPLFTAPAVIDGDEIVENFSLPIGEKNIVLFFYPKILLLFVQQNYTLSKLN